MWWLVALSPAHAGDAPACDPGVSAAAWGARLDDAEAAYARLDVRGFDGAMEQAARSIPCLGEVVPPSVAARYHRLVGLRLYARGDEAAARSALQAALRVDPTGSLPLALVPEGHEARSLATGDEGLRRTRVPPPRGGHLYLDGLAVRVRADAVPTLVQRVDAAGVVGPSVYLSPGQPLPPYPHRHLSPGARLAVGSAALAVAGAAVGMGLLADEDPTWIVGASSAGGLAAAGLLVAAIPW